MRRAALLATLALGAGLAAAQGIPADERRSAAADMSADLRALQADDLANPAMLADLEGAELWGRPAGPQGLSCAACHGDAAQSMRGVAARHPAWDAASGAPIDLAGRILFCRTERQGAEPWPRESPELLGLAIHVGRQSRGLPVTAGDDPRLGPALAEGARLYETRMGQLGLSCAECHDANWGRRLGGARIPQAYALAYPIYRLEWQRVGSFARRLRSCTTGVRAEPFADGGPEAVALELHLAARARGMPMEIPGVRP